MSDNRYRYLHYLDLTPGELFFFIALEETRKELGLTDLAAASAILLGERGLPDSGKVAGATKGTSVLSVASRNLFRQKLQRRLPTIIRGANGFLRISLTRSLGAFVGRTIPLVGSVMLAVDAYCIVINTVRLYNRIVRLEDRVF